MNNQLEIWLSSFIFYLIFASVVLLITVNLCDMSLMNLTKRDWWILFGVYFFFFCIECGDCL